MLLTLGGFDWEDKIVGGGPEADVTWPELKPTSKWGQIPILKLADGSQLAQTQARQPASPTRGHACAHSRAQGLTHSPALWPAH